MAEPSVWLDSPIPRLGLALALALGMAVLLGVFLAIGVTHAPEVTLAQGPTTRYVAPAPTGGHSSNDCTNSSAPCATIGRALSSAEDGDAILVAGGTHTEDLSCWVRLNDEDTDYATVQAAVDASTRPTDVVKVAGYCSGVNTRAGVKQVVYISKTLSVQGGYTTTNWTVSDPEANPTILSAEGRGRVVYISGDISPTIEGLRITRGNAAGLGGATSGDGGGGVYVVTATVTLSDDEVVRNRATDYGGGIYNAGRLALDHSTVSDNATDNDCPVCFVGGCPHGGGGGIDNRGTLTLDHSIVCGNATSRGCLVFMGSYSGGDGGGILNNGALTLIDSTVSDNVTGDGGVAGGYPSRGGDGGHGGGICNRGTLELVNSTVGSNTTGQGGAGSGDFESFAGDGGDGGGIYSSATLMVVNSTLSSNTTGMGGPPNGFSTGGDGGDGGGLYLFDGNTTLLGSTVSANVAHDEGGGLYLWSSDATLDGNTIVSNTAAWGGGLYLSRGGTALTNNVVGDNRASIAGSGLYIRSSSPRLLHTTIARNVGGDGTGISVHGAYSTVALTNTILVSHTVGITVAAGNTATLDTTLWGNGVWANGEDWGGAGTIITGSRNYWGDPALVNPDAGDYHLGPGSAAIDRGVETEIDIDIDGDLRPIGPAPDVGADEAWIWVYLPVTMRNH